MARACMKTVETDVHMIRSFSSAIFWSLKLKNLFDNENKSVKKIYIQEHLKIN